MLYSFWFFYLVIVCFLGLKLGYLYYSIFGELFVLSEDFIFLKSMVKIVDFRVFL